MLNKVRSHVIRKGNRKKLSTTASRLVSFFHNFFLGQFLIISNFLSVRFQLLSGFQCSALHNFLVNTLNATWIAFYMWRSHLFFMYSFLYSYLSFQCRSAVLYLFSYEMFFVPRRTHGGVIWHVRIMITNS